jgi:hypothetical protein
LYQLQVRQTELAESVSVFSDDFVYYLQDQVRRVFQAFHLSVLDTDRTVRVVVFSKGVEVSLFAEGCEELHKLGNQFFVEHFFVEDGQMVLVAFHQLLEELAYLDLQTLFRRVYQVLHKLVQQWEALATLI